MALWHRIGPTRLHCLSRRCKRWYSLLPGAARAPAADRADGRRLFRAMENPLGPSPALPGSCFSRTPVRYFAAPVQAKPKPNADASSGPRINGAITASYVRIVTNEGHGIVSRREALDRAKTLNLDLVEVQRTANPPVCKIMDFHREKFKQEEKEKERAKSKSALTLRSGENKEVRFKAKTELKDLKIKAETVTRLMERGYRVKCTAMPTGKEEEDLGGLLSRLLPLIEDVSVVESGPHVDTRQAYVIVRHVKFATKKAGKKISEVVDTVSRGVQNTIPSAPAAVNSISRDEISPQGEEKWEPVDCSSETMGVISDQVEVNTQHCSDAPTTSVKEASNGDLNEETGWSGFNATDKFEDIFDFDAKSDLSGNMDSAISNPTPEHTDSSKTLHQKLPANSIGGIPASNPGLGSLKAKLELKKEPTDIKISTTFVSSHSEPSVVESNRYSKRSELKGRFQPTKSTERNSTVKNSAVLNQLRMPQLPTGNESDRCGQLDPKQRKLHPSNTNFPSPSHGIFSSPKTAGSGDQSKLGGATVAKPSDHSLPSQSYGIFSASKTTGSGDQKNSGSAAMGKSSNPSSPPTYGIFSTVKTVTSGDQRNLGDVTVGKPSDPSSSTLSNGIFSAKKPAVSSDQRNLGDAILSKPGKVSPSSPSYGIFNASRTAASGDQRSSGDEDSGGDRSPLISTRKPLNLSESETESLRQDIDSRQGRWGVF